MQVLSTVPPTKTQLHDDDIVKVRVPLPVQVDGGVMQLLAKGVKLPNSEKAVPPKLGLHPLLLLEGHVASVRVATVAHVEPIAYWTE